MTSRQFILFVAGLMVPALYQRLKFAMNRQSFYHTELRRKSGLNIHHGHWGLLLAMISTWMLIFSLRDYFSISLASLGWGLMLDEIVPMLKMPSSDRTLELEVYGKTRNATIALIIVVIIVSSTLFLSFH